MRKKSIEVAKKLIVFLMTLLLVVLFCSVALAVYNLITFNVEMSKYIYLLIGVFLIPLEYALTGRVDGIFQDQANAILCLAVPVVLIVLIIIMLANISKMHNGRYSSKKRALFNTVGDILLFVFLAYFVLSSIFITVQYSKLVNIFNDIGPDFVKTITTSFGFNLIVIKEIVVAYFGAFVCLFGLISFIVGLFHKSTKVRIITSINFYSSEFEEDKAISNTKSTTEIKQTKQEEVAIDIPENDPKAQNLIKKIMQLDELRNQGKISNVDYTRLRQKAIRRYKN